MLFIVMDCIADYRSEYWMGNVWRASLARAAWMLQMFPMWAILSWEALYS